MSPQSWRPLWHPQQQGGLRMALFAFFDESGKFHDGEGFICLCGYLGAEDDWEPFNKQWAYLLRKHHFDYIHFTQFESECRRRGWDEDKTSAVLTEFIEAIRNASVVGFAVGIDGRYFRRKFEINGRPNVDPPNTKRITRCLPTVECHCYPAYIHHV
jgi:hypothetical protein